MMKNTKFCNKAFYDSNYDTKNGIPHFSRPKPLLFTLYQCSLEMFNQCFCKSNKRSLPHRVCVAILVSVYKPQNSPTEIAFCFCYHGNFDSVYVAGSCHVCYPVWRSVWSIQRWPSNLEWLLLKVIMTAWSCKVGRDLWLVFWLTQSAINWLYAHHRQTPLIIFFFCIALQTVHIDQSRVET